MNNLFFLDFLRYTFEGHECIFGWVIDCRGLISPHFATVPNEHGSVRVFIGARST